AHAPRPSRRRPGVCRRLLACDRSGRPVAHARGPGPRRPDAPCLDDARGRRPAGFSARRLRDAAQSEPGGARRRGAARGGVPLAGRACRPGPVERVVPLPRHRAADGSRSRRACPGGLELVLRRARRARAAHRGAPRSDRILAAGRGCGRARDPSGQHHRADGSLSGLRRDRPPAARLEGRVRDGRTAESRL
ncbi:MAG: hypothetical protein AVDCRST_MAG90-270, partial [uncultured Microvirga sp.]